MLVSNNKNNKKVCPSGLIGKWKDNKDNILEITNDCSYYTIGAYPYSFPDPNTLHYGKDTFYQRVNGNPSSLIGVWRNDEIGEELTFREDGTYSSIWTKSEEYSGTYTVTETHITMRELKVTLEIDGSNITWIKSANGSILYGTFEIVSPEKWILRLDGLEERTYSKV